MREAASDESEIDPDRLALAGHDGNPVALLNYFLECLFVLVAASPIYADATRRMIVTLPDVSGQDWADFKNIFEREPFAKGVLTYLLADQARMATFENCSALIAAFFKKFP